MAERRSLSGDLAQLVEQLVRNEKIAGSNPAVSTRQPGPGFYGRGWTDPGNRDACAIPWQRSTR
jgi:hypothetical protein